MTCVLNCATMPLCMCVAALDVGGATGRGSGASSSSGSSRVFQLSPNFSSLQKRRRRPRPGLGRPSPHHSASILDHHYVGQAKVSNQYLTLLTFTQQTPDDKPMLVQGWRWTNLEATLVLRQNFLIIIFTVLWASTESHLIVNQKYPILKCSILTVSKRKVKTCVLKWVVSFPLKLFL